MFTAGAEDLSLGGGSNMIMLVQRTGYLLGSSVHLEE